MIIKKYELFNESIKSLLKGPTEDETIDTLKNKYNNDEIEIDEYITLLFKNNMVKYIEDILKDRNFDEYLLQWVLDQAVYYRSIDIINLILKHNISKDLVELVTIYENTPSEIKDIIKNYLKK